MKEVIGVDLGVRSAHISTAMGCFTFESEKDWPRGRQIQYIYDCMTERFIGNLYYAFVEEPVVAGARNLRTSLRIAQVSGAVLSAVEGELVPVSTWKKATVGSGNASKDDVRDWLSDKPEYSKAKESQDWIDATCLRLYGETVDHR